MKLNIHRHGAKISTCVLKLVIIHTIITFSIVLVCIDIKFSPIILLHCQHAEIPQITNTFCDERDHFAGEENLMYTCQFEGFPLPKITFFFNGAVVPPDSGVTIVNNSLTIHFPQVNHSGIYQCIVSNKFGDDQQAWLLEIRQPSKCNFLEKIS